MSETTHTKLLYLEDMQLLTGTATILSVTEDQGRYRIVLDQTIFYPQGGGQPYDQGIIQNESGTFIVEEVRFAEGVVYHIGHFSNGTFATWQTVSLKVDPERRALHTRLHSAGHLLDMAIHTLGLGWKPGKGYHFPDGPYIEYEGTWDENEDETKKAKLKSAIEAAAKDLIAKDIQTTIRFMPKAEMHTVCAHVPTYLPEHKPARVVLYGDFGVPCGGTHVASLGKIRGMSIRKMSMKKGIIRVAYEIQYGIEL